MGIYQHTTMRRLLLPVLLCGALIAGCTIGAPAQAPVVTYDLGPVTMPAAGGKPSGKTVLVTPVAAPTWLDHTTMMYRLNHADPMRPRVYSGSYWKAAPAEMLTERIRVRLTRFANVVTETEGVGGDYSLRLDLEEFAQSFPQADTSHINIRVRATLIDTGRRTVLMQHTFEALEAAPPNAVGAVPVYARSAGRLLDEIAAWVEQALGAPRAAVTPKGKP